MSSGQRMLEEFQEHLDAAKQKYVVAHMFRGGCVVCWERSIQLFIWPELLFVPISNCGINGHTVHTCFHTCIL